VLRLLVWVSSTVLGVCIAHAGTPYSSQVAPDPYAALLAEVVVVIPVSEDVFETRVNYEAVAEKSDLVREVIASMVTVDPGSLAPKERKAWAANLYNLLILDILSRHFKAVDSISEIGDRAFSIFDAPMIETGGQRYSLNEFERKFMFEGDDADPRLHFAIVCGAKGCPPLWSEPLRAQTVDAQLDAMVVNTLHNPRYLRVDDEGQVSVWPLFEWYKEDFSDVGSPSGVAAFLSRYREDLPQEVVVNLTDPDLVWDWSLNIKQ
jgi:hypothetical protein